jgi:Membrane bound O-acyl transferase family
VGPVGWLPLLVFTTGTLALYRFMQPWVLMWSLAASLFAGLKWLTWFQARKTVNHNAWRSAAYLLAWPGMDAQSFLDDSRRVRAPRLRSWCWAAVETAVGAALLWQIARLIPSQEPLLRGWLGMLGVIFLLHFGIFQAAALLWQSVGIDAAPIMSAPLNSRSLSEFWGRRWNLGFRDLAYGLVFDPLQKRLGVGTAAFFVFVLSGLIHDLVISVPARGGYGLPTAYFLIQGAGVALERSSFGRRCGLRKGVSGRAFMLLLTVGPVFWLFHPPFVLRVIMPFMKAIHAL